MPQKPGNYDEALVPNYTLPDPLVCEDGSPVSTPADWHGRRRPEILRLFEEHVYGRAPGTPEIVGVQTLCDDQVLDGAARRRELRVTFRGDSGIGSFDLLLYTPSRGTGPSPAFLGLNFFGNQAVDADPAIAITSRRMRDVPSMGVVDGTATEASRGACSRRWAIRTIVERGYALATVCCADFDPDYDDGFRNGVHGLYDPQADGDRASDAWATIAGWAWGLSRALDVLIELPDIDGERVAVMGHSRLGKAALWASACDERFAITVSNNSGCAGAAIFRRRFGETIRLGSDMVPYWYCSRFRDYCDNEDALPIDQHELVALVAPRPVYIASAEKDLWADPRGEFLSAVGADPVFRLLGTEGFPATEMPRLDEPVVGAVGYHVRTGGHDVTDYDWERFLDFADRHFVR